MKIHFLFIEVLQQGDLSLRERERMSIKTIPALWLLWLLAERLISIYQKKYQTDLVSLLRCWKESLLIANYSSCLASKFRRSIKRPKNCCSLAFRSFLFLAALALFFRRRYWAMTRHNISTWGTRAVIIRNFNWYRCWSPSDLLRRTCSSMVNCCRR